MKARIALCQLTPLVNQPEKNLVKMKSAVRKCSKSGVKLCIFPEDFLYGILRGKDNIKEAGEKFQFWTNAFCELAKKYRIDLIPGSLPLSEKGNLYNTTVYINSKGKVVNKYRKTNLWLSERFDYRSSPYRPKSFQSFLGKTMIIICWDLMNHQLFESAVKQNVDWIIVISLWSTNQSNDLAKERGRPKNKYPGNMDSSLIDSMIRARVYEYNLGIIFCNFAKTLKYEGENSSFEFAFSAGRTQVVVPLIGVVKKLNNKQENILISDLPDIKEYIKDYEILYGRRNDIKKTYP